MSNFQFLESHWTDIAKLGDLSEKYVYSDPNTSIIKQGMLSEVKACRYSGSKEEAYKYFISVRWSVQGLCKDD